MSKKILLCCDLDRTLLPNGNQPESANCREIFRLLSARDEIDLAYVSGRDAVLIQRAIAEFDIPVPRYAIGDVGTTIYEITDCNSEWNPLQSWRDELQVEWQDASRMQFLESLGGIPGLSLQEPEKQSDFKISFYTAIDSDSYRLLEEVNTVLGDKAARVNLVWSIDEIDQTGLLDVLPACANKLHAIEFLMKLNGYRHSRTVFAGDSGNDVPVLTSGLQAVLVANADASVRDQVRKWQENYPEQQSLYIAQGNFLGMNGNYSAGILEGLAYFIPETLDWMRTRQFSA